MAVDYNKTPKRPEDASAELAALYSRQAALVAEQGKLIDEVKAIAAEMAAAQATSNRETQIDALINGTAWQPTADFRDRIGENSRRQKLITEALDKLSGLIREERIKASRLIVADFKTEQEALAADYFANLAKAVAAHKTFGEIKARLEAAGVNSGSLHDFGLDLLGYPGKRDDHAAFALRDGVRRGYIAAKDVPAGYL